MFIAELMVKFKLSSDAINIIHLFVKMIGISILMIHEIHISALSYLFSECSADGEFCFIVKIKKQLRIKIIFSEFRHIAVAIIICIKNFMCVALAKKSKTNLSDSSTHIGIHIKGTNIRCIQMQKRLFMSWLL